MFYLLIFFFPLICMAFYNVVTPLNTKSESIWQLLANKMSVLRLSPIIKNLSRGASNNPCYSLIRSNPYVSGFPKTWCVWVSLAVSISLVRLPPDGLSLPFPSVLSMLVPNNLALFCLMYYEAIHILSKESSESVPTITYWTWGWT
jgi:hypothetical protein